MVNAKNSGQPHSTQLLCYADRGRAEFENTHTEQYNSYNNNKRRKQVWQQQQAQSFPRSETTSSMMEETAKKDWQRRV